MNLPASAPPWQPLTFGGVAAFAHGSLGRLIRVQALMALIATTPVLWFLVTGIMPALERAIAQLPNDARIQEAQLRWPDTRPATLTSTPFLAIKIDPATPLPASTGADLDIVLGPKQWRIETLLGRLHLPYPAGWSIALDRSTVDAWWGARQTALLVALCSAWFAGLVLTWWCLSTLYTPPILAVARLAHRPLTVPGAWRLANAALLPGALLLSAALLLYSLHRLLLPGLLTAYLLHIPIGWLYAIAAPLRLPKATPTQHSKANPFNPQTTKPSRKAHNPFADPHHRH